MLDKVSLVGYAYDKKDTIRHDRFVSEGEVPCQAVAGNGFHRRGGKDWSNLKAVSSGSRHCSRAPLKP